MPVRCDTAESSSMQEALESLNVEFLKQMLSFLNEERSGRKEDLVARLLPKFDEEGLRSLLARLDEIQRAAVAEAVHDPEGRHYPDRFQARYGRPAGIPRVGWTGLGGCSPLSFFFFGGHVLPRDLRDRLRSIVPPPVPPSLQTTDTVPATIERHRSKWVQSQSKSREWVEQLPVVQRATERAALHDLVAVLRLIDQGKVAVGEATGRPTGTGMTAVSAVLCEPDFYAECPKEWTHDLREPPGPIQAFAWPLLVQGAGLARVVGSRLQLTPRGRAALGADPATTLRDLWQRWEDTDLTDEFSRIEHIKGQGSGRGRGRALAGVPERRAAINAGLAECPLGQWIAVDEFFRFLRAAGHDFHVAADLWKLYIGQQPCGSLGYQGFGEWEILQGRFALCYLFEYAATAGLVDVAYVPPGHARGDFRGNWGTDDLRCLSRYDGLLYFRVNALGAWCLGSASTSEPAPIEMRSVLRVLPNLEIATLEETLAPADRLALDGWCERTSERTWRIEGARLLKALEAGRPVAEFRDFLLARSGNGLPETVAHLLANVERRGLSLRDAGAARLIECAEPALAAQLANDARTSRLCLRAGERHVAVPAASEAAFGRAVRELGLVLPPASAAPGTPARQRGRSADGAPRSAPTEE